jgi:hypothetical protein
MLLSNRYNISRFRVGLPVSWAPDFLPAVGGYYTNLSHRPKLAPAKSAPPPLGGGIRTGDPVSRVSPARKLTCPLNLYLYSARVSNSAGGL